MYLHYLVCKHKIYAAFHTYSDSVKSSIPYNFLFQKEYNISCTFIITFPGLCIQHMFNEK